MSDCSYIFNLLQNFHSKSLVIDTRSLPDFQINHISGAISISAYAPSSDSIDELATRVTCDPSNSFAKRRRNVIVIIHGGNELRFVKHVEGVLRSAKCRSVYTLEEDFNEFYIRYPFLCSGYDAPLYPTPTNGYPTELIPESLYLGSFAHASDPRVIDNLSISHIVNATLHCNFVFESEGILYFRVPVDDLPSQDISSYFESCFQFIFKAISANGRVLIHCERGVSRSATLAIMYFMRSRRLLFEAASALVKYHREVADPNPGFVKQLIEWENSKALLQKQVSIE